MAHQRSIAEILSSFSIADLVSGISPEGAAELLALGRTKEMYMGNPVDDNAKIEVVDRIKRILTYVPLQHQEAVATECKDLVIFVADYWATTAVNLASQHIDEAVSLGDLFLKTKVN